MKKKERKKREKNFSEGSKIENRNLTIDQRISVINTCLSYAIYESNVYWQRNAIYLTINSIIFGAILAFSQKWNSVLFLLIGCFGIFLNWYWVHVNKYSKFFAERWREDARIVAIGNDLLEETFKALLKKPRIKAPSGKKPSQVMNQMSGSFILLWIIITLIGLYLVSMDFMKYLETIKC